MTDDDLSEHLDPELDAAIAGTADAAIAGTADADTRLPGPMTLPRLVVALHLGAAAGLLPFALAAAQNGETGRLATFGFVAVTVLAAGVAIARVAARQY